MFFLPCPLGRSGLVFGDAKDRRVTAGAVINVRGRTPQLPCLPYSFQPARKFDVITPVDAERSFVDPEKGRRPFAAPRRVSGRQPPDGERSLHETGLASDLMDDKIAAAPVGGRNALPTNELNKLRAIALSRGLELARALGVRIV